MGKAAEKLNEVSKNAAAAKPQFTELNSVISLVQKGFEVAARAADSLFVAFNKGQALNELSGAFSNLYGKSTELGTTGLGTLREALGGLVSDIDALKTANLAAQAGLEPDQFLEIAKAADALGDAVGKDTVQAFNDLTTAVASGQDRALKKQYGIVIDNTRAEQLYAVQLGTTRENLTETEKLEAKRIALLEAIKLKHEELGDGTDTAGDAAQRLAVAWENAQAQLGLGLINSESLKEALDGLALVINSTDWVSWGQQLGEIIGWLAQSVAEISIGFRALGAIISDISGKVSNFGESLSAIADWVPMLEGVKRGYNLIGDATNSATNSLAEYGAELLQNEKTEKKATTTAVRAADVRSDSLKALAKLQNAYEREVLGGLTVEQSAAEAAKENERKKKKAISETASELKQAQKAAEDFNKELLNISEKEISADIEKAVDSLNSADFNRLKEELRRSIVDAYVLAHKDLPNQGAVREAAERMADIAAREWEDRFEEAAVKNAEEQTKELKKNLQEAADFWTDVFSDAINGEFELDNLEDALKRAAAGFAGQLTASLVGAPEGVTSAQGAGQALAQLMIGAVSSYYGGTGGIYQGADGTVGAGYGGTANSTTGAAGTVGTAAGTYAGGASMGGILGIMAALYAAMLQRDWQQFESSDTSEGQWVAALGTYLDVLYAGLGTAVSSGLTAMGVGVAGQNLQEQFARDNFLEWLEDQFGDTHDFQFSGMSGGQPTTFGLDSTAYNVDFSNPLAGQAVGLTQGLADLLTSGDNKLGDDLAGIFTNAVLAGENFNEVMINTLAIMDDMGINAAEAKDQLLTLFMEGELGIDEFGADIAGLNILATENLTGPNSILDALNIVFQNLDDNRKAAVKGLELLWTEMKEQGITNMGDLATYISSNFGVQVEDAFAAISAAGINEFTDLSNLSADQIFALFNALQSIAPQMTEALAGAIEDAGNQIDAEVGRLIGVAGDLGRSFGDAISDSLDGLQDLQNASDNTQPPTLHRNIDSGMGKGESVVQFNIDARGAGPGVAQEIERALYSAKDMIVNEALYRFIDNKKRGGGFATAVK